MPSPSLSKIAIRQGPQRQARRALKRYLTREGLSASQFGQRCGWRKETADSYLCAILHGRERVGFGTAVKIEQASEGTVPVKLWALERATKTVTEQQRADRKQAGAGEEQDG